MSKQHKIHTSTKYLILLGLLLLIANLVFGFTLIESFSKTIKETWDRSILNFANTVAAVLDGDEIKQFNEEEDARDTYIDETDGKTKPVIGTGSQRYEEMAHYLADLLKVQQNEDIKFVYLVVKQDGKFVFTVDGDLETPSYYGQEVVYTESEDIAWAGTPSVDSEPYTDPWGTYYTAWSPIFDGENNVVSLVGVDFDAQSLSQMLSRHIVSFVIFVSISLFISIAIIVAFSIHLRVRYQRLGKAINSLATDMETLFSEISGESESLNSDIASMPAELSMDTLREKTAEMQKKLKMHLNHIRQQANIDYMTNTGNVRAYYEKVDVIEQGIKNGTAKFSLVLFDINGLKKTNDVKGHECGNFLIRSAAKLICETFGATNVFRIGGDEFVVVLSDVTAEQCRDMLSDFDEKLYKFNSAGNKMDIKLTVAKGYSEYTPQDKYYKDVFNRADNNMYADKEEHYKRTGETH